jgi:cell division protein FtsI (penicillin-binding protein 3)
MKVKEKKWIRFRIYVVAIFFLLGLGAILARAYQLQIIESDRLQTIAQQGYVGTIKLPPKRGTIYEREGHELAISVEVASVYAHPSRIEGKRETGRALARVLGEKQRHLLKQINKKSAFVWVKRRIPPEQGAGVLALGLKGVGVTTETKRYYPGKEIAAHLIGFVGSDNQGLEGLERRYEKALRGSQYSLIQMRDALGRLFAVSRPLPSGEGMRDLVLTIDKDIQYKAQKALRAAVEKSGARAGHCLVVDPMTGEILAMAVVPEFDPNLFLRYKPHQWRNRPVTDCYEPGSTMKVFLLAACLEEHVVAPQTRFHCEQGRYEVHDHVIRDTHEYGDLSVRDIIVHSSNIGAVKVGEKLGYEKFHAYLRKFGFGRETGVGLLGERGGFIRPVSKAGPVDRATAAFGQGMTTTSLQLIMAMAAVANGGKLMRPYVVRSVLDESGRVIEKNYPRVVRRVISEETARKVTRVLEGVVGDQGTGPQAAIRGFRVAGKTGTAQKVDPGTKGYSETKHVATFVGFVPADRPRLVILVMVDEPEGIPYGGTVAGPVFREVGQWSLNHLHVNPQIRLAEQPQDEAPPKAAPPPVAQTGWRVLEKTPPPEKAAGLKTSKMTAGLLPDFSGLGMREVFNKGRSLGLNMVLQGTGLAVHQEPEPGSPIRNVSVVRVQFRPPT